MKKRKKIQKKEYSLTDKQLLFVKSLFIGSFFLVGIFHEFTACIFVAIELILIYYLYQKNKGLIIYDDINFVLMIFIIFMYLFSVIYAIDRGMAFIGFVTMLTVILFLIIAMQLSTNQRNDLCKAIPLSGIIMIMIGLISLITGIGYKWLFVNNRVGGFFQYPNTFALFLLLGIIVIYNKKTLEKKEYLFFIVLLFGILSTGSRTVYLITFGFLIYFSYKNHNILKISLCLLGCLVMLLLVATFTNVEISVIERISDINLSSSTFLGRLLYYKDGIFTAIKHPLGLGYLGYYFIEPQIQTGIYSIRFIHNDLLQIILDVGILPGFLFIWIIIKSFLSKNINSLNRQMIIAIILHSMLDFSLQYKSIFFILILCLDFYSGKKKILYKDNFKNLKLFGTCINSFIVFYIGVSMSFHYFGLTDLSIKYLPFYTEAMVSKISTTKDLDEGILLAKKILKINSYVPVAYDVLAVNEYINENYDAMIRYKEKSIDLQKYNIKAFDNYITMLSTAIEYYQDVDADKCNEYAQKILNIPFKIDEIKNNTSYLAYQIADKPDFNLSIQSKKIIEMINESR